MGLFDDFMAKLTNAGKGVSQKVNETVAVTRLQGQISAKEAEVKDTFVEIGMAYFEKYKDAGECEFMEKVEKVIGLRTEIDCLGDEIDKIKGVIRCPECGATVDDDALFCPKCGWEAGKPFRR